MLYTRIVNTVINEIFVYLPIAAYQAGFTSAIENIIK